MSNILETILPTKQSRWIAGIGLPLAPSAAWLGDYLQKLGLQIEYLSKLEVRLLLVLSVLSINLFSLVISLVRSINCQSEIHSNNLKLKYAIYWDKNNNPHCPSCKSPAVRYEINPRGGKGYYCRQCKDVFPMVDATGNDVKPEIITKA